MVARQFRMNVGTIVELPLIKVDRMRRGPVLGRGRGVLYPGAGGGPIPSSSPARLLRFEGVKELVAQCSPATGG